jgi:phosphotransferase system HPr-like phosphotransfer protein
MEVNAKLQCVKNLSYDKVLQLVHGANKYESYILIESERLSINVKGLLALSTLPSLKGELSIRAYGVDAQDAIDFTSSLLCLDGLNPIQEKKEDHKCDLPL